MYLRGPYKRPSRYRRDMVAWTIGVVTAVAALLIIAATSDGHYTPGCEGAKCKRHVIEPYRGWLKKVAFCETGGTMNPRILSPGGRYRGLFQFDLPSWRRAGGRGDPAAARPLEQRYRAVVWLHRVGVGAWPRCGR